MLPVGPRDVPLADLLEGRHQGLGHEVRRSLRPGKPLLLQPPCHEQEIGAKGLQLRSRDSLSCLSMEWSDESTVSTRVLT